MTYTFEKFQQQNVRLESRITITKSNSLGFPTKFSDDNEVKKFKYAVLYFDKQSKAIGIQFINNEEEPNKFTIIKSDKYGASIVAQSFFKVNNIDTKKYHGRYNWKTIDQENVGKLFVIELDNPKLENN